MVALHATPADINYAVCWLKAHAREFGRSADRVGLHGTSSGGHQVLLSEWHTFVNEHPFSPNAVKAVEMAKAFIKKYGSGTPTLH